MGAYPVATYSTHSPPDQQGAKLADQVPALCPGAVLPLAQRTEMWGYPGYGAGWACLVSSSVHAPATATI